MNKSAQLKATLNSLAMMNVANLINNKKKDEKSQLQINSEIEESKKSQIDGKIPLWEDYQDENEDFFYID